MMNLFLHRALVLALSGAELSHYTLRSVSGLVRTILFPWALAGLLYVLQPVWAGALALADLAVSLFAFLFSAGALIDGARAVIDYEAWARTVCLPLQALPAARTAVLYLKMQLCMLPLNLFPLFGWAAFPTFWAIVMLSPIMISHFVFSFGLTLAASGLSLLFPEALRLLPGSGLLLFLGAPVRAPAAAFPCLTPLTPLIRAYRLIFCFGQTPSFAVLFKAAWPGLAVFMLGWLIFAAGRRRFFRA